MADSASLLDEELSSFVFNYLTENSGSQYGEEEVCSDRLDTDFSDIDLSQLDTSDFDSVSCLSELQWCSDHPADASPASIQYSTADELFEIEENAALLAALTDSLDGIVDAEVGGLPVFPALGEEPDQEEEEEDNLLLSTEDLSQSLGVEAEDPSLLKKLLLTPPNVPTGSDAHKDRVHLHRHLTTAQDSEGNQAPDTDEEEEEEEDEDSESEEDEEEEGEEEEESSSSEIEGTAAVAAAPSVPAKPQFSSEKEMHSVVELITYMHTYCLPSRKQQGWERKERDLQRSRARPEASRQATTSSHSRVVLVASPGTSGGLTGAGSSAPKRLPFARRKEIKANSLLRELLQQSNSFDVSKPYRLHISAPSLRKDSSTPEGRNSSSEVPKSLEDTPEDSGSFSVRRSRRLASFPSRFAKRLRPVRLREGEGRDQEEREEGRAGVKLLPTQAGGGTTTEIYTSFQPYTWWCDPLLILIAEKRACLLSPYKVPIKYLMCLTPPTTPPHKPVEDELFKPAEGGKGSEVAGGGSSGDGGGGGSESAHPASTTNCATKGPFWLGRGHHQRKLPEQTELYAQLRRTGQAGDGYTQRNFGDHDYCALSLGERRKRSAAMLGAMLQAQGEEEAERSSASRSPSPILHLCEVSSPSFTFLASLPTSICSLVTQNMLRKRFQVFGNTEDCKVIICNEGAIAVFQNGPAGLRRLTRKRYIDLDEAGPGPVKSKYDALDFDTLLKEAQKSMHR
uniref:Uncharacterized protein n=1 Tax=Mola mola TaxID=94237 RepID=A0A3Q3W416_MOLML